MELPKNEIGTSPSRKFFPDVTAKTKEGSDCKENLGEYKDQESDFKYMLVSYYHGDKTDEDYILGRLSWILRRKYEAMGIYHPELDSILSESVFIFWGHVNRFSKINNKLRSGELSAESWLFGISKRLRRNYNRRRRWSSSLNHDVVDPRRSPEEVLYFQELKAAVVLLLKDQSQRNIAIIKSVFIENRKVTYSDLAKEHNISISAVKQIVRRFRIECAELRMKLNSSTDGNLMDGFSRSSR